MAKSCVLSNLLGNFIQYVCRAGEKRGERRRERREEKTGVLVLVLAVVLVLVVVLALLCEYKPINIGSNTCLLVLACQCWCSVLLCQRANARCSDCERAIISTSTDSRI